jgi:hypothetical protein
MKKKIQLIVFLGFSILSQVQAQTPELFFEQANEFLRKNVTAEGKVDYATLKKSPGELLYILDKAANLNSQFGDKNTSKAFWINAYNLQVIKAILDNYPMKTVNDIPGFFKENNFIIAKQELTLDDIENTILREIFLDPGIHFVLCNSANGGAPLLNLAYRPETVVDQMKHQAKLFINNKHFMKINRSTKTIQLPKIFEWYKSDFVANYFNEIDFINLFLDKKVDNTLKIETYDYDWSLNQI